MPDIMTVREAAEKWGIKMRRVQELIRDGRLAGVYKIGTTWVMPANTQKPIDKRLERKGVGKAPAASQTGSLPLPDHLSGAFQRLLHNKDMFFQFLDLFPYMIEIFAPDGTAVFLNRAGCEDANIPDASQVVGHYNILKDPVVLDALGQRAIVEKAFLGERINSENVRVPYEDSSERYEAKDESFNKILYKNISCFPLWDDNQQIAYIAMVFITTHTYTGRKEMTKAQEYINKNWYDSFDRDKAAAAANVSPYHFSRMFRQFSGVSPLDYYKQVKVEKIKEKLLDPNLSITQAFAECGVDSKGAYMRYFKDFTGATPTEYRSQNMAPKE